MTPDSIRPSTVELTPSPNTSPTSRCRCGERLVDPKRPRGAHRVPTRSECAKCHVNASTIGAHLIGGGDIPHGNRNRINEPASLPTPSCRSPSLRPDVADTLPHRVPADVHRVPDWPTKRSGTS